MENIKHGKGIGFTKTYLCLREKDLSLGRVDFLETDLLVGKVIFSVLAVRGFLGKIFFDLFVTEIRKESCFFFFQLLFFGNRFLG